MALNTLTKVGGAVLVGSLLVTGLQFKQGSLAQQAARFIVREPVKAALEVMAFVQGSLEEVRQEHEQKPRSEEERGNPAKEQPTKPEHSMVVPEVVDVLPSADGKINVRTRIDNKLINVALERAQVEALQTPDRQSPNRVDVAFTVQGHRYTTEIDKDMLIAALANR